MQSSSSGGIRRRVRRLVTAAAAVGLAATMTGTASAAEAAGPAAPGPVSPGTAASWPGELPALSGLTRAGTSSVAALPLNAINAKGNWCAWNPSTKTGGGFGTGTCYGGDGWVNAAIGLTLDADKTEDAFVRSSATGHLYGLVSGQSKAVDQGPGWNSYTAITSVGNIGGTAADDVLARDHSGVLWVHPGYWNGHLGKRVRISTGWNAYTALFGKYDYNGDHRTDVLAVDHNDYVAAPGHRQHQQALRQARADRHRLQGLRVPGFHRGCEPGRALGLPGPGQDRRSVPLPGDRQRQEAVCRALLHGRRAQGLQAALLIPTVGIDRRPPHHARVKAVIGL